MSGNSARLRVRNRSLCHRDSKLRNRVVQNSVIRYQNAEVQEERDRVEEFGLRNLGALGGCLGYERSAAAVLAARSVVGDDAVVRVGGKTNLAARWRGRGD
jgi:hypothetical protein